MELRIGRRRGLASPGAWEALDAGATSRGAEHNGSSSASAWSWRSINRRFLPRAMWVSSDSLPVLVGVLCGVLLWSASYSGQMTQGSSDGSSGSSADSRRGGFETPLGVHDRVAGSDRPRALEGDVDSIDGGGARVERGKGEAGEVSSQAFRTMCCASFRTLAPTATHTAII
jgi:hypothetical protein